MKEMKVIRKRRRRYGRYRHNGKRVAIISLVTLAAVCLVCCACLLCVNYLINNKADSVAETSATDVIENDKVASVTIQEGSAYILSIKADKDIISKIQFSTQSSGVVSVDSGGRVDAIKEGKAVITAECDGFMGICNVTVVAAKKSDKKSTERTTAYTANEDIAAKNKKNKKKNPYSIQVNTKTNTVTVFTYNSDDNYEVPVRAMVCSCGEMSEDNRTPVGDYSVYFKSVWLDLVHDVYGQYITGFSGHYLFHSLPYNKSEKPDSLQVNEYNKLGTNASQGCVRLAVADAKWVYDNCDIGTQVHVISEDEKSDPLGKPNAVKISDNAKWDPTDPNKNNPYLTKKPVIGGADNKIVKLNELYDPMEGITAKDTCGNNITDKILCTGNVITSKPGVYFVTYSVEDAFGLTCSVTITITVK